MDSYHKPVLLKEIIEALRVETGKKYIDATLGGGGHAAEILKRGGLVLGIDADEEAIRHVEENIKYRENLILVKENFKNINQIAREKNFDKVSGIIFDLGLSSHQVDSVQRGFSYQRNAPLDMRMDESLKVKASDLVNVLTKGELYELFTKLGEERNARAISSNIARARRIKPIETTEELSLIVQEAYGMGKNISPKDKALTNKRVYQALRIAVNDELNNLKDALPKSLELLESEGRLAVITFHSLEDRIVKDAFNCFAEKELGINITKKPITPDFNEMMANRRSKSAKLRVFEKN